MKQPGSFLLENILSQPKASAGIVRDEGALGSAADRLKTSGRLFIVGTGTSFHGAMVGEQLFRSVGLDAWAVPAFEFSQYPRPLREDDGLVLLSHRGTKRFSRASFERAPSERRVAITGLGSSLEGPGIIYTIPQETSPVITVSHVTTMLRLAQLAALLAPSPPSWAVALQSVPAAIEEAVGLNTACAEVAGDHDVQATLFFVGGGPAWANALEGALKVREAAYVSTDGYEVEEILHGPAVGVHSRDTVVIIAEPGPSLERAQDVARAMDAIGARVVAVGSAASAIPTARWTIATPALPEVLAPIVNVIPLQWLAYHISLRVGADADSFHTNEERYAEAKRRVEL